MKIFIDPYSSPETMNLGSLLFLETHCISLPFDVYGHMPWTGHPYGDDHVCHYSFLASEELVFNCLKV